jgi:DNA-binding response OmpR family regulator
MKVVVVESDRDLLAFLQLALMSNRHEVDPFLAGAPALAALEAVRADVLLCDLGLPDLDGEVVARSAAHLPHPPRIVLMSGEPTRLERARPLAAAVIHKPFHASDLLTLIDSFQG